MLSSVVPPPIYAALLTATRAQILVARGEPGAEALARGLHPFWRQEGLVAITGGSAELALHEHVEIEQTFVLEGSLVVEEGEVTAGNYVWRPKGNRHSARSPNGALVLSIFLKPNIFLTDDKQGVQLR